MLTEKSKQAEMNSSTTQTNGSGNFVERSAEGDQNELIGSDLTAAQLYESIENNIQE